MELFKKRGWDRMHSHLESSFGNVRKDTGALFDWVAHLRERIDNQEEIIRKQNHALQSLHNHVIENVLTAAEVRGVVGKHFAIVDAQEKLCQLQKKLNLLSSLHDRHSEKHNELQSKVNQLTIAADKKQSSLADKLVKNISRNGKSYIKNVITGFIEKYGEIPALQLKTIIVDEQKLCSKSSFYRLLGELEAGGLGVVKEGKQKLYFIQRLQASSHQ